MSQTGDPTHQVGINDAAGSDNCPQIIQDKPSLVESYYVPESPVAVKMVWSQSGYLVYINDELPGQQDVRTPQDVGFTQGSIANDHDIGVTSYAAGSGVQFRQAEVYSNAASRVRLPVDLLDDTVTARTLISGNDVYAQQNLAKNFGVARVLPGNG